MHEHPAFRRQMHGVKTIQPAMPVDARTLIEPALVLRSIDADHYRILSPVMQEIGDIISRSAITAEIAAQITIVDPYLAVAKDAVELQQEPLPRVRRVHRKGLAIPANAARGEQPAYGMIPVTVDVVVIALYKWRSYRPVMRQLHR